MPLDVNRQINSHNCSDKVEIVVKEWDFSPLHKFKVFFGQLNRYGCPCLKLKCCLIMEDCKDFVTSVLFPFILDHNCCNKYCISQNSGRHFTIVLNAPKQNGKTS